MIRVWLLPHNGRRYSKCGIKLLLNCLPTQMYVKIPNDSTTTKPRIMASCCCTVIFSKMD